MDNERIEQDRANVFTFTKKENNFIIERTKMAK